MIEVVRLIGAEDRFISAAFVRRLARRAAIGGFAGAAVGCGALALLPSIDAEAGAGAVARAGRPRDWALLGLGLPLAATADRLGRGARRRAAGAAADAVTEGTAARAEPRRAAGGARVGRAGRALGRCSSR